MTGGGWPTCHVCGGRCVCGQVDGHGRPAHLGCQSALPVQARTPKLAAYPTSHRIPPDPRQQEGEPSGRVPS
jgi:hypothetical protein